MTEDEARTWTKARWPDAYDQLGHFTAMVSAEMAHQNLIARSTVETVWTRHVVDSLQLPHHAPPCGRWIDVGTGAGFPGMVIAIAEPARPLVLVEPRTLRADFLRRCADRLSLDNVEVVAAKIETVTQVAAVISARAVARLDALFDAASKCSDRGTTWLLPKGRNASDELAMAKRVWQGTFHVKQSLTDPYSSIIVAADVRRRRSI